MNQSQIFFIEDRAQTLAFEARNFPSTAETALSWIFRAKEWARQNNLSSLVESMGNIEKSILAKAS